MGYWLELLMLQYSLPKFFGTYCSIIVIIFPPICCFPELFINILDFSNLIKPKNKIIKKMTNEINFTQGIVKSFYNSYAILVLKDAVQILIKNKLLTKDDEEILKRTTAGIKTVKDFFKKSYIIYLSNGILSRKDIETIKTIKNQLMFELAIKTLLSGINESINYLNLDDNLFSLHLNQPINTNFNSIHKKNGNFIFYLNNKEVKKVKNNISCKITKYIDFLEKDKNPFNIDNTHPNVEFVSYDLNKIPKEKWILQFKNAYQIIKDNTPKIYQEIYPFLDAIVPHGYEPNKQLSSSYFESPGILYLSYTDTDIKQAEAIIHEVHHTIFNIMGWKYNLYNNDMSLKYYSAYRPDARHIKGCFLGLHAFVAVQNFYRNLTENNRDNQEKFIEILFTLFLKNKKVIDVLEKYADFTHEGKLLFGDIKTKYNLDSNAYRDFSKKYPEIYNTISKNVESHLETAKKENNILLH
jgi:hypothetical protein